MRQRKVLFSLILLWSILILGVVLAWARFGTTALTTILTVVSTVVAVLSLVRVESLRWSTAGTPSTPRQIDEAAEMLTVAVRKQWDEEARRRRLQEAQQMPVRWRAEKHSRRESAQRPLPVAGELDRLVDHFAGDPRPMVVIGEPGSGKTGFCVILTVNLLDNASRHRIPVLLQIWSWDPSENFDTWLIHRLMEDYPFLGNEALFGATTAAELVAQRRVLPILDGLDETSAPQRAAALRAIEDDWSSGQPFVLTCRTEEFAAVSAASVLPGTLVVRLLPLAPEAAADYLRDTASDLDVQRWEPLLTELTDRPDGPLAEILTRPLMLFLARTAYEMPGTSPDELLDPARFADSTAIERHLLDRFVPTVFATRPHRPVPSPTRPSRQWKVDEARRTLTFLATHLDQRSSRRLAWWQLRQAVPGVVFLLVRTVLGGLNCALLGWIVFGLFGRPALGVFLGLLVGVTAALPLGAVREKRPRRFVPRVLRRSELAPVYLIRDVGFAVVGVFVGTLVVGLIYGLGYGILIGLVFGLAFGLVRRFTEPTGSKEPVTPVGVLRGDRAAVFYGFGLGGLVGAVVGGFLGGVVGAADYGLIIELTPVRAGLLGAATGMLVGGAGLGMLVLSTSAWGQFITTRLWLAARGVTPRRLMTFLQDAHKLGVLRQVGPRYEFRHALLQARLVEGAARDDPTDAALDVSSPAQRR